MKIVSRSDKATMDLGQMVGKRLKKGFLCLYGELGAGKTTFVRGLAKGMGIKSRIKSPTFTYGRIHGLDGKFKLYHFDFYRLAKPDELLVAEMLEAWERGDGVIVVEWAEKVAEYLPDMRTEVYFEYIDEMTRKIKVKRML